MNYQIKSKLNKLEADKYIYRIEILTKGWMFTILDSVKLAANFSYVTLVKFFNLFFCDCRLVSLSSRLLDAEKSTAVRAKSLFILSKHPTRLSFQNTSRGIMIFTTSLQNNFSNERLSFQKKQKPPFGETFPPFATQSTLSLLNGGVSKQL